MHSHPESPDESGAESLKPKECHLNQSHLKCLERNKIDFDHELCQHIEKPTLQFIYRRYCTVNDIHCEVDQKVKDRTWKGSLITKTDITNLFVAKTTWHNLYHTQMPAAEKYDDMLAWLTDAEDAPSDIDLWGVAKDHYTLKDLDLWLKEKAGKKGKAALKGKAKAEVGEGTGKGKEKEKSKSEHSHKKKPKTG